MSNIDEILEKWVESKKQVLYHENQSEKYREAVERYMTKKSINTLEGTDYTVTKRSNTRETLAKKDVPVDVWNKYSNKFTYNSYYVKER